MKKNFIRLSLIGLVAVICGIFSGCNPDSKNSFSVTVSEVGPEYVNIKVTAPSVVEFAYILDTKEKRVDNPVMIFKQGKSMTVKPNDVVRISIGLEEKTQYYLYAVAKIDSKNYSQIVTLPFKTTEYDLNEMITVVDRYYDGYKVRLTVPEETKKRGNGIRYTQCDIMMYNYAQSAFNSDDFFNFIHNGNGPQLDAPNDRTLLYTEETNWYEMEDTDGDGEPELDYYFNPISPGEPIVAVAAEFAWMDGVEDETDYIIYPSGWEPGYYMPLLSETYYTDGPGKQQSSMGVIKDYEITTPMDPYWEGAFQRKLFHVLEPQKFDGKVDVKLVEASPIDLVMDCYPDEDVVQYAIGIFNDAMYDEIMELCCGREEYMQWAITSYFGAYTFGTKVASGNVRLKLTDFYYQDAIGEDTEYTVFITAMGDKMATIQNFQTFKFSTTEKVKTAPVIRVSEVKDKTTPYLATFNIRCTTASGGNPVTECYYGANYLRDWLLAVNGGKTYHSLVASNKKYAYFSEEEIEKINSPEGLDMTIQSVDGETTRLVVLGYNDEYTPNDLLSFEDIEDCPAVADCTTPWVAEKDYVEESSYIDLVGDWTATATLRAAADGKESIHKSKITIAADLFDYPSELPEEVYDIYKENTKYDEAKVDALWEEFKAHAKTVTDRRLKYQNRLVAMGWLDKDSHGRLETKTPYDLFVDTKYKSVDVSSIYNDYGPKWYIEAVEDEDGNVSLVAPFDSSLLPPSSNWSVPFYFAGMELEKYYTITKGDGWTTSFPVEVSEDRNTITIKPLLYTDASGKTTAFYPQMLGIDDSTYQTILENPVVSEVVLTRGWAEPKKEMSASVRSASVSVPAATDIPARTFKQRTGIHEAEPMTEIEASAVTMEQFKEKADRLVEQRFGKINR